MHRSATGTCPRPAQTWHTWQVARVTGRTTDMMPKVGYYPGEGDPHDPDTGPDARNDRAPKGPKHHSPGQPTFCIFAVSPCFIMTRTALIRSLAQTHRHTRCILLTHAGSGPSPPPNEV